MLNWKQYAAVLAGLSVLALAGCSQSSGSGNPATEGPNAADKASMANNPKPGQDVQGAQAAAAKAAAAKAAAADKASGGAKAPAGTTGQ